VAIDDELAIIADKADLHRVIDALPDDAKVVIVSNRPLDVDGLRNDPDSIGIRGFGNVKKWEAEGLLRWALRVIHR
jgi:predicted RNase H-like nuclease (RuvC/YqgF family)